MKKLLLALALAAPMLAPAAVRLTRWTTNDDATPIDGSNVTGIASSSVSAGVSNAWQSYANGVTNGSVLRTNSALNAALLTGALPAMDGSALAGVNAANAAAVSAGVSNAWQSYANGVINLNTTNTVLSGQPSLPQFHQGMYSSATGAFLGIDPNGNLVQNTFGWGSAGLGYVGAISGDGGSLTNLNAANLTGTVPEARSQHTLTNLTITGPMLIYNTTDRVNGSYSDASGQIHSNAVGWVKTSGGNITAGGITAGIQSSTNITLNGVNGGAVLTRNGIGQAQGSANGLMLINSTPASNGVQQLSPPLVFAANEWITSSSKSNIWRVYARPTQSDPNDLGFFVLDYSLNGSAFSDKLAFQNSYDALTLPIDGQIWFGNANADLLRDTGNHLVLNGFSGILFQRLGVTKMTIADNAAGDVSLTGSLTATNGFWYPQGTNTAPSAALVGGDSTHTNHLLKNVGGGLIDYWSDGTTVYSKQLAP
jgi:hypothetical protein